MSEPSGDNSQGDPQVPKISREWARRTLPGTENLTFYFDCDNILRNFPELQGQRIRAIQGTIFMSDNMRALSATVPADTGWLSTTTLNMPPDEVLFLGSSASPSEVTRIQTNKRINFLNVEFKYNVASGSFETIRYRMEFTVFITSDETFVSDLPGEVIGQSLNVPVQTGGGSINSNFILDGGSQITQPVGFVMTP